MVHRQLQALAQQFPHLRYGVVMAYPPRERANAGLSGYHVSGGLGVCPSPLCHRSSKSLDAGTLRHRDRLCHPFLGRGRQICQAGFPAGKNRNQFGRSSMKQETERPHRAAPAGLSMVPQIPNHAPVFVSSQALRGTMYAGELFLSPLLFASSAALAVIPLTAGKKSPERRHACFLLLCCPGLVFPAAARLCGGNLWKALWFCWFP